VTILSLEKLKSRHKRLFIALKDLRSALTFSDYILKNGLHYKPWEKRGNIYNTQAAFTTSLIIFYSRAFTTSKGLPKLGKSDFCYNDTENVLHEKILELRHQVYAHSDDVSYDIRPFKIEDSIYVIESVPFFRLTKTTVKKLSRMIRKEIKHLEIKEDKLAKLIT
jgi:hypothetical protein